MAMSVASASSPRRMSLEEWGALDEDIQGELVEGVLEEGEIPSVVHEVVVYWLLMLLGPYYRARSGLVLGSGVKLAVRPKGGRLADVVCFAPGTMPEKRGVVHVAPEIVVEVVSPAPADERRDRVEKPDDYAAFGVRYYWLVDPELRSFEVWELGADGRYVRAMSGVSGRMEGVPGCEGLVVDLGALWEEIDRLPG
jgi:Uma2 family endonuclease